jgi:GNAT superfamily N-acetyltransferase
VTDSITLRPAQPDDIDRLIPLMRGYYRDDGLVFDESVARCIMLRLLSESQWGCVVLAHTATQAIGYGVLCLGFSLELGGNDAYIDELFVVPEHRGQGVAQRILDALEFWARTREVVALHLEVDRENHGAQRVYHARGYDKRDRYYLMTKVLG